MKKMKLALMIPILCCAFTCLWAQEQHLQFPAAADTFLSEAAPDANFGKARALEVSGNGGSERHALLRFDLSVITNTALVLEARLRLYVKTASLKPAKINAAVMLARWNEGLKAGAPAEALEPTWREQLAGLVAWDWRWDVALRAGSEIEVKGLGWYERIIRAIFATANRSCNYLPSKEQGKDTIEIDVTCMTADWVRNPLGNKGVLLRAASTGATGVVKFASRESDMENCRPVLSVTFQPPLMESTEAEGGPPRLTVGLSRAMPLVNESVFVRAKAPGFGGEKLTFTAMAYPANFIGEPESIGGPKEASGDTLVEWNCTPRHSGIYNVLVTAMRGKEVFQRVWLRVPVLKRQLVFFQTADYRARRYTTAKQTGDKEFAYWRARGVRGVRWVGGAQYNDSREKRKRGIPPEQYLFTPEQYLEHWDKNSRDSDGIMIDEMYGDDDDTPGAKAIELYHEKFPGRFIYPYTAVIGQAAAESYRRAADVVLLETYVSSPRVYGVLDSRWNSAVRFGLDEKAVATIAMPDATTVEEIRRQARRIRRLSPTRMPGVSIYTITYNEALIPEFDRAIEDYWLGPVLFVTNGVDAVWVRNIGQTDCAGALIQTVASNGCPVGAPIRIANLIAGGEPVRISMPAGIQRALVKVNDSWTYVIYQDEDYAAPPEGKIQPLSVKPAVCVTNIPLNNPTVLKIVRRRDFMRNSTNILEVGRTVLPATRGRSFTLSWEMTFESAGIYPEIAITAASSGDDMSCNLIGMYIARSDNDVDVRAPRAMFKFNNADVLKAPRMHATMMNPIEMGRVYRFQIHYERGSYVRALACCDGRPVWDTGELVAPGFDLEVDELRFGVTPTPYSVVETHDGGVRMTTGEPRITQCLTRAVVRNVRVSVFD